jgi:Xaa-Pro aminopeptidase
MDSRRSARGEAMKLGWSQRILFALLLVGHVMPLVAAAQEAALKHPLPLRDQARVQQQWLAARLDRVLPQLMRKHGVQMWLVICREYNEDPVFYSLVSATTFAARRRTIYVLFDRGDEKGVERLALGGSAQGGVYKVYRDSEVEGRELWGQGQWALLRKLIEERNPATIGVNISRTHAFSDGLSAGEREALEDALGPKWISRFVRTENLPLEYVSLRVAEMLPTYRWLQEQAHALIARAFSNEVIKPGVTTTSDVVWWFRQELHRLGFDTWFQPSVDVQRPGLTPDSPIAQRGDVVIERGDVLHCDFGLTYMGLNTDTQHMGYVLRVGETEPPAGIRRALENGNRLQDIVMERMRVGRSGNEILADALAAMKAAGISGSIYSHPIGDHGHGAGPLVGLWDRQQGVPGRGDVLVLPNTWFSIELAAATPVPEWKGQELRTPLEEDAVFIGEKIEWALRRQTRYHLIK